MYGHSLGQDEQLPHLLRAGSIPQDLHVGRAAVRGGCPTAQCSGQAGPSTVPRSRPPARHQQTDSLPAPNHLLAPRTSGLLPRQPRQAVEHAGLLLLPTAVYTHTAQRGPCLPAASGDRSPWPSKQDVTPRGGTTKSPGTELHRAYTLTADPCCHPRSKGGQAGGSSRHKPRAVEPVPRELRPPPPSHRPQMLRGLGGSAARQAGQAESPVAPGVLASPKAGCSPQQTRWFRAGGRAAQRQA